ncbi:hypothetical protein GQ53DRAFT_748557 [Thozetella sp. PMI_491]|nr:hypothetical protein GQ53DRAFT_748557 [Thozetella sp. PMI_491]
MARTGDLMGAIGETCSPDCIVPGGTIGAFRRSTASPRPLASRAKSPGVGAARAVPLR